MNIRPEDAGQEGTGKVHQRIRFENTPSHNPIPTRRKATDIGRLQLF